MVASPLDLSPAASSSQSENKHAYPRPQLRRKDWISLNGIWDFAFDEDAVWTEPYTVEWSPKIKVPFSPETRASGLNASGFFCAVWYRRSFDRPELAPGQRLLL